MEPVFETVSLDNVQQDYEAIWYFQRKSIWTSVASWIIGTVVFGLLAWLRTSVILLAVALYYGYMAVRQILRPKRAAKSRYQNKLDYYDGVMPPITCLFYEDHCTFTDIDSYYMVPYKKVKSAIPLKSCLTINLADGRTFLISRNGFKKGTPEELQEFLCEKCSH